MTSERLKLSCFVCSKVLVTLCQKLLRVILIGITLWLSSPARAISWLNVYKLQWLMLPFNAMVRDLLTKSRTVRLTSTCTRWVPYGDILGIYIWYFEVQWLRNHIFWFIIYLWFFWLKYKRFTLLKYNRTEKEFVSTHSEIWFQIWYDDVFHEWTTFSLFPNFIFTQHSKNHEGGGNCVISLFLEMHIYFQWV